MIAYLMQTPVGAIVVKTNVDTKYNSLHDLIAADMISITIRFYNEIMTNFHTNPNTFNAFDNDDNLVIKAPVWTNKYIIETLLCCDRNQTDRTLWVLVSNRQCSDIYYKLFKLRLRLLTLVIDFGDHKLDVINEFARENYYTELKFGQLDDNAHEYELEQVNSRNRSLLPENVHAYTLNTAIILAPILQQLGPYLFLEIIDWTNPYYHMFNHRMKIAILQKVYNNCNMQRLR